MIRWIFRPTVAAAIAIFMVAMSGCAGKHNEVDSPAAPPHDPTVMVPVGGEAPDFSLKSDTGKTVRLADFRGKENVVLVFYPGDMTKGCTTQLCAIRDDWSDFRKANVAAFGVNPADAKSHREFVEKYNFPFPILVDSGMKVAAQYGCGGGAYVTRTVYAIDKRGIIVFAQRGMPSTGEVLKAFQ